MSEINPFFETDAELLADVRERLLAMVGLPVRLGPITRRRLADLCQVVGLRISRADDAFWLILGPGQEQPNVRPPLARVLPTAVQPGRYALKTHADGTAGLTFRCRECGPSLRPEYPGARRCLTTDDIVVTDRFLHDRWHAAGALATLHDLILAETLTSLFGA